MVAMELDVGDMLEHVSGCLYRVEELERDRVKVQVFVVPPLASEPTWFNREELAQHTKPVGRAVQLSAFMLRVNKAAEDYYHARKQTPPRVVLLGYEEWQEAEAELGAVVGLYTVTTSVGRCRLLYDHARHSCLEVYG